LIIDAISSNAVTIRGPARIINVASKAWA